MQEKNLSSLPVAYLVHDIKGRARIRISSWKNQGKYLEEVVDILGASDWIKDVIPNVKTGSILILHNGNLEKLDEYAREKGLFRLEKKAFGTKKEVPIKKQIKSSIKGLDLLVKKSTHEQLDLSAALIITLISLSGYQILRGKFIAPSWYTSLWFAANLLFRH
jgi:hypothetical protein